MPSRSEARDGAGGAQGYPETVALVLCQALGRGLRVRVAEHAGQ